MGGGGCSWSHTFPDGQTHRYIVEGIKSPEQLETEILSLAVWLWSLKDYLKERSLTLGKDPNEVESYVSGDNSLSLCADVANLAKHGKLRKSRSGHWPQLGRLEYTVPQEAMSRISFRAFEVETDVAHPELVTLKLPILNTGGLEISEGLLLLSRSLASWERFNELLERAA